MKDGAILGGGDRDPEWILVVDQNR